MLSRTVWRAGMAALFALACVVSVRAAAAQAELHPALAPPQQATATLTGQVRSADGVPLAGIKLAAFTQAGTASDRQPVASAQTDAAGRYTVTVPAGTIWMNVMTQDVNGQSFWGYDREPVAVAAGATLADQDFIIAIRVVAVPPPPVATPVLPTPPPAPPVEPPVGMPASGTPSPLPGLAGLIVVALLGAGLALRRRAAR